MPSRLPESPPGPLCSEFETLASPLLGPGAYIVPGTQEVLDEYLPDG